MVRLATINDLNKDEDNENKNTLYTGGNNQRGGGSGLSVFGPPNNEDENDQVSRIFGRAQQQGLTGDQTGNESTISKKITVYRNGFTVDDGEFRSRDAPESIAFLSDLAQGVVPREIELETGGKPIDVKLIDKREEDYVAPHVPYVAFSGEGNTMSSARVERGALHAPSTGSNMSVPQVDESKPTTTIQIKLHDGRKIRAKLNLFHTIMHIHALIQAQNASAQPYYLLFGFPPAQITDHSQTIEGAGLINTVVTQKLL